MTITGPSRRESRVTTALRHTGRHTAPTRPNPTQPFSGYVSHPSSLGLKGRPTMDGRCAVIR